MKKLLLLAVMALGFGLAANAQSSNPNALENRAVAAAHECLQGMHGNGITVEAVLTGQGRCIDGGTVNFYEVRLVYHCPPPLVPVCLVPAPTPVATVVFDCDNRVSSVTCL